VPYKIVIHIQNQDPVLCEVDELPAPTDRLLTVRNPRRVDGKDLTYIAENVMTVLWPVDHINFIEVLGGEEEDQIIGFVRE
jgi:hypothetical protein